MTEINVIKVEKEQRVLTREEREVIYQDLSNKLNIPYFYFANIINLEDESVAYDAEQIKPAFTVLLFRRLLNFPNVLPIVKALPLGITEPVAFARLYGVQAAVGGKNDDFAITLQTQQMQKVVTEENLELYLNAPPAEKYKYINITNEMMVRGFIITSAASVVYNEGIINTISRIKSGSYYDKYLWDSIFDPYFINTQKKLYKTAKDFLQPAGDNYYFTFKDEVSAKQQAGIIFDFLIHRDSYKDYARQYIHLAGELEENKKLNLLTNKIIQKLAIYQEADTNILPVEKSAKKNAIQQYLEELEKEKLITGKLGFHYSNSVWFDLITRHMSIVMEKLIFIHKKETSAEQKKQYEKDIDMFMKQRKQDLLTKTYIIEQNEELFKQLFQEMEYRYIYIEKFGFEKYANIQKQFLQFGTVKSRVQTPAGFLFDYIDKSEKEIVISAYKKRDAEFKSDLAKSKAWIALLREFQKATDPKQRLRLLEELTKFMDKKSEDGWMYSKEGVPMLCKHTVEKTEMEAKHMLLNDIRNSLLKYAGDFNLTDAIYCKICGEILTYTEENDGVVLFEGDQPVSFHNLEDELKDYIWRITSQILRSNIQFKTAVSNKYVNMLVTSITMKIYELVAMIENKLSKAKTNTQEEIDNKKSLFTAIYVYAILCKIVLDNYPEMYFAKMGNVAPTAEKLLAYALDKIILSQNVILNKLPDITDDFIKSSLDKAFQNIVMLIDKAKLAPPPEINLDYSIYLDPIFLYSAYMKYLSELQDLGKTNFNTIEKLWRNTYQTSALFKNFDNSKEKPFIYDDLLLPKFSEKLSANFLKLANGEGHYVDMDDFIENIYAGYLIESYRVFIKYVQSHVFIEDLYKVNLNVNEKDEIVSIQTSLNDNLKQFFKQTANVRVAEKIYKTICKHYRMLAFADLPYLKNRQFKYNEKQGDEILALKYGYGINKELTAKILGFDVNPVDKFHKHKWNIHAYIPVNEYIGMGWEKYKKLQYYKTADVKNIPEEEFKNLKLVDNICQICLHTHTNVVVVLKNIRAMVDEQQTIANFYNYYENRCPNPGKDSIFHIYKSGECVKCGFVKSMYYKKDEKYFYKFNENFEKEILSKSKIKQVTKTDVYNDEFTKNKKQEVENITDKISDYVKKWKYNTNIINEFVIKTFDIIQKVMPKLKKSEYLNIFNNIGLAEKYIYEDILSGKEAPYKDLNDILAKMRINRLRSYISEVFYNYSILKNHKHILVLPADIKLLLDGLDAKETTILEKIQDINKIYQEDKQDYYKLDKIMLQEYSDQYLKLAEFQTEYLFNLLLYLQDYLEKQNKKVANHVMVYLISKIMIAEKTTARLKEAKKTAIEAGQTFEPTITGEDHEDDLGEDPTTKKQPSDFDYDFDYEHNEDHDAKL